MREGCGSSFARKEDSNAGDSARAENSERIEIKASRPKGLAEDVNGTLGRIEVAGTASTLVIPIGRLFSDLTRSMESK